MTSTIAILGASGLVGRAVITELVSSGDWRATLIGRDAHRLHTIADIVADTGSTPYTLATGADRDWAAILHRARPPDLVLNRVGPASDTAPRVLRWCVSR